MEESLVNGIEFYYAGKMVVIRLESYYGCDFDADENPTPCLMIGDIMSGLLVDTQDGTTRQILYTHDGLLDKGYMFGCTGDLADTKLMKLAVSSMYGVQKRSKHEGL